ncbi:MAG TPA: lysophospholipid acyltransferase family protein [Solirubrobacteraceae bacterium]|nr:lysophospholipid acyltransferase family protein [Solirubrobacteraceae bacterium]
MPDVEIKAQVYSDSRPPEYFQRYHEIARRGPAGWTYELVRYVVVPYSLLAFRARSIDSYNVPNGPVILAPNHGSFMDHFFTGTFVRRRVRFMAKSQLFQPGIPSYIFSHGGVFPVRRGHHDEEAFITAFELLRRGEAVVMYPEGGRSRTGDIAAEARPGVGRLALESGAPVVPVAILGSHQVRNWKRLQFPRVTVQYGSPFRFETVEHSSREQQQEAATYILERIRELHSQLKLLGHRGSLAAARDRERNYRRGEENERFLEAEREAKMEAKREAEAEAEREGGSEREAEREGGSEREAGSEREGGSEREAEAEAGREGGSEAPSEEREAPSEDAA